MNLKKWIYNYVVYLLVLLVGACASQPQVMVEVLPGYDAVFERKSGWTGADGAYSVELSDSKILWLFGDTWVGAVRDGRHVKADLVNNSIGIQYGRFLPDAVIYFYFNQAGSGEVSAFIRPDDGRGWFWPYHGTFNQKGLFIFLVQIERTQSESEGLFAVTGNWLVYVSNPDDSPRQWRIKQLKIPWSRFGPSGDTIFGSSVLRQGDHYYIYGTTEDIIDGFHFKHMIVARVPVAQITEFSQWRFFSKGQWVTDVSKATRISANMANEYSVSFMESLNKYIVVYSENSTSADISARLAPEPHGPWGEPFHLYTCPEESWHEEIFCYAAKAHPGLATTRDGIVVSYVTNSSNFDRIANDARLYRPRFIRVRITY